MRLVIGILSTLLIVGNVTLNCIPLFLLGLVRVTALLLHMDKLEGKLARTMDLIIDSYVIINRWVFKTLKLAQVEIHWSDDDDLSKDPLSKNKWYMVVSNHQSWTDILLLQTELFHHIPPLKFFTKQQLVWVPFLGQAMWLLDFPYVKRLDRKKIEANPELLTVDREATRLACEKFKNHPTSVLNFLEGTRNTPQKYAAQATARFKCLLNPKSGGLTQVLSALDQHIHKVLDVTIQYAQTSSRAEPPTFWVFRQGLSPKVTLQVICRTIPTSISEAPSEEARRQATSSWVESLWQEKDATLIASQHPVAATDTEATAS